MTDESKTENSDLSSLFKHVIKINEYTVGVAVLCYIAGFAISNIYLGSLGILNLDILRVKYILTGFLFLTFLGIITYPLYGLVSLLRDNHDKPILPLLERVVQFSLERYSLMVIVALALHSISNFTNLPVGIPQLSQPQPWTVWANKEALNALISTLALLGRVLIGVLSIFTVIFLVVIAINPKTGDDKKVSRWEWVKEIIKWIVRSFINWNTLFLVLGVLLLGEISSLITFITNSQSQTSILLNEGWFRFLATSLLIYAFIAVSLFLVFTTPRSGKAHVDPSHRHMGKNASLLIGALLVSWIILPAYSLGVYPSLPQQVGGGQVVPIEVTSADTKLEQMVSTSLVDLYLVDQTSDSVILLIINRNTQDFSLVEISRSQLNSIKYLTVTGQP